MYSGNTILSEEPDVLLQLPEEIWDEIEKANKKYEHQRRENKKSLKRERIWFACNFSFIAIVWLLFVLVNGIPRVLPLYYLLIFAFLFLVNLIWTRILLDKIIPIYPYGFCSTCGYNIKETPERCPECGLNQ